MRQTFFILFIFLCSALFAGSINPADTVNSKNLTYQVDGGDTLYLASLHEVYIYPRNLLYKNEKEEKFFWKTVRDVKRTLPYAHLVASELEKVNATLENLQDKKAQKKFINQYQKEVFEKYEADLRRMTVSQGKMLIKLVDRQCDRSTFELIKLYKGGFTAFFWQGIAGIFGANLKSQYDASDTDKVVERIILLVEAGQL
ncbi:MAG: DUF4294 domain-containing protein [Paludibacter sp.]|jgi:hypothetical protein|nr:DUF4294 domain-containing protein [Paludibacter sp.]